MKLGSENYQFVISSRPVQSVDSVSGISALNLSFKLQVAENQFLPAVFSNQTDCGANVVRFAQEFSIEHFDADRIAAIGPGRTKIACVNCRERTIPHRHRTDCLQSYGFIQRMNHLQASLTEIDAQEIDEPGTGRFLV